MQRLAIGEGRGDVGSALAAERRQGDEGFPEDRAKASQATVAARLDRVRGRQRAGSGQAASRFVGYRGALRTQHVQALIESARGRHRNRAVDTESRHHQQGGLNL